MKSQDINDLYTTTLSLSAASPAFCHIGHTVYQPIAAALAEAGTHMSLGSGTRCTEQAADS